MRFPVAAMFFVIASFIFLAVFAVGSLLLTELGDGLQSNVDRLDNDKLDEYWRVIPQAFGVIGAIFFITGILLFFVMDATMDEPEYFYERRR